MRLSNTLSLYIGRHFLLAFLGLLLAFILLVFLFDTVELLRRAGNKPNVTFAMVIEMALMRLPYMGQRVFPFAVLFGGMLAFARLTRNHELVVARAAGVSVWQFLLPALFLAFFLGLLKIMIFNPLASATLTRFERLEASRFEGRKSLLSISQTGLWLRQSTRQGQSVIHAERVLQEERDVELFDVTVFVYGKDGRFVKRIQARDARLEDGFWYIQDAWILTPEQKPLYKSEHQLETDLTPGRIQDSFAPPETMSFWTLPAFIKALEEAGFTAIRHRLYWHSLLATPLLMCAMVLIAATFALRRIRRGGAAFVIVGGVFTGFLLYFFSDLIFALGLSGSIPVVLAAWTPSGVAILLGLTMLLHLEDG